MKKFVRSAIAAVALLAVALPAYALDLSATASPTSNVQASATLQNASVNPVTPATGLAALAGVPTIGSFNSISGAVAVGASTSYTGNFRGTGSLPAALVVNQVAANHGTVGAVGVANAPTIGGGYFGSITAAQAVGATAGITINQN